MAVGEFTGDGTMKLAITDGQGVYIYDLTKARDQADRAAFPA